MSFRPMLLLCAESMPFLSIRNACKLFILPLFACKLCFPADLLYVKASEEPTPDQTNVEQVADFYGLGVKIWSVTEVAQTSDLERAITNENTVAVIVESAALTKLDRSAMVKLIMLRESGGIPLLVLGISPTNSPAVLDAWTDGAIVSAVPLPGERKPQYKISNDVSLVGPLAGFQTSIRAASSYLKLGGKTTTQEISHLVESRQLYPVFLRVVSHGLEVFLSSNLESQRPKEVPLDRERLLAEFASISPLVIFVKYAAGERGWHVTNHYANLTVDDPWLRESYGNLVYNQLLSQMQLHNFHTTIAFIPWNYDRSDPKVVSLFRDNPDRLSISIHGDNHDHREFGDYSTKDLASQKDALGQAIARMERFRELTGIPYDKVMVFPHGIAPMKTVAALKQYRYLATVNSSNVPMDQREPNNLWFALRSTTLQFGNFPSLKRRHIDAAYPEAALKMDLFLDNPLLFYCHQDDFYDSIGIFNSVADQVNKLDPTVRWTGLGRLARHLYLVKLRPDGDYDVKAFSSSLSLENQNKRPSMFRVSRVDDGSPHVKKIRVNGHTWPYRRTDKEVIVDVLIQAGASSNIEIEYENEFDGTNSSIVRKSPRVYFLRIASDFRDIVLSQHAIGRLIIDCYEKQRFALLIVGTIVMLLVVWIAVSLRSSLISKLLRASPSDRERSR